MKARAFAIEARKYAHIIGVTVDPLQDVKGLGHVDSVMKGGVVYKDTGRN